MMEERHSQADKAPSGSPEDVVKIVVDLVQTGPLVLGTYTTAQVLAVNGPSPELPAPEPPVLAEAVRSLVAIGMAVPVAGSDEIDVQGDLGVVLTIQKRSRLVVDVVYRGHRDDRPWHLVLLPQPEGVTLLGSVDELGLHHFTVVKSADARGRLAEQLPAGKPESSAGDSPVEARVEQADDAALITVARFSESGLESTTDLVAFRAGDGFQALRRDSSEADWQDLHVDKGGLMESLDGLIGPLPARKS
jgi:hypothetical protein